jgi:hypothetical protein
MKSTDSVGITFANMVVVRGVFNNVINITLGAYQFSPSEDGATIENDLVVTARLRLDKGCAKMLHEALGGLLADVEKAEAALVHGIAAVARDGVVAEDQHSPEAGKLN